MCNFAPLLCLFSQNIKHIQKYNKKICVCVCVLKALKEDIIRKYYIKFDLQPSVILFIIKHLCVCVCVLKAKTDRKSN